MLNAVDKIWSVPDLYLSLAGISRSKTIICGRDLLAARVPFPVVGPGRVRADIAPFGAGEGGSGAEIGDGRDCLSVAVMPHRGVCWISTPGLEKSVEAEPSCAVSPVVSGRLDGMTSGVPASLGYPMDPAQDSLGLLLQ